MQVFLVKDPAKGNKMDFAGFMKLHPVLRHRRTTPSAVALGIRDCALANPAYRWKSKWWPCAAAKSVTR
jgi:hypothetical protein